MLVWGMNSGPGGREANKNFSSQVAFFLFSFFLEEFNVTWRNKEQKFLDTFNYHSTQSLTGGF